MSNHANYSWKLQILHVCSSLIINCIVEIVFVFGDIIC